MELGIEGRKAIIGGASAGLGKACALALAKEGVDVTIVARTRERIEAAGAEIAAATGVNVQAIAVDINTDEGRKEVLAACPSPDIIVNNSGGPPPGDFRDWGRDAWLAALNNNMLGAIFMIKDTLDGMIARRFGRIVNITSSAVKAPIPILGLSNGARSGLTGFVAGIARETAIHNVTINNLLPGDFGTERQRSYTQALAETENRSYEEMRKIRVSANPTGRFGRPEEFGAYCVFLCSVHGGFITGQNLLIDGGKYPGTF
ncbi:MAG: SDR family oxidoreductase [Syntrophales bacterium]|jgi:3-oxoacyl-[acyl-carrier protein] reductase|nr:SDR family oxidoreductase [Syntrophales bacterium]